MIVACAMAFPCLSPTRAGAAQPPVPPAITELSQCVQTNGRLSVLMLVDESGSLHTTDLRAQRVDGLRAVLIGLSRLADTSVGGRRPRIDALMAGFSGIVLPDPKTTDSAAWHAVSPASLDGLLRAAGNFQHRDFRPDTDYGTALLAARRLLSRHAADLTTDGGRAPCKALVWFTDGRYAISDRTGANAAGLPTDLETAPGIELGHKGSGAAAVDAGRRFLCSAGGLMDDLRSDGVVKFTVALASRDLRPPDDAFLDALTTGGAGGTACGSTLAPTTGLYLRAEDSSQLFFTFTEVVTGPTYLVKGSRSFTLPNGLRRFVISATVPDAGTTVELKGPTGGSLTLSPRGPGRVALSGARLTQHWVSPTAFEVQGDLPAGDAAWRGRWSLDFSATANDPAAQAYSAVQLYSAVQPTLERKTLARGGRTDLRVALVGADGTAAARSSVADGAVVTGTWTDPANGASRPLEIESTPAGLRARADIPERVSSPFAYVTLTARFPQVDGVSVLPEQRSFRLLVRIPEHQGFPEVTPSELALPSLVGQGAAHGTITVTGNAAGAGCAWIPSQTVNGPDNTPIAMTADPHSDHQDGCVRLRPGQQRTFHITFDATHTKTGTVNTEVPVLLTSSVTPGTRTVRVQAGFEMVPPLNVTTQIWIAVLLTVLGALLPILLLMAINRHNARFTAPERLRALSQPVVVEPLHTLHPQGGGSDGGEPAKLRSGYLDHEFVGNDDEARETRHLDLDGVALQAVTGLGIRDRLVRLFRGPYGVARDGTNRVVAGGAQPMGHVAGSPAHEVPVALPGTWIFVRNDDVDAWSEPTNGNGSSRRDDFTDLLDPDDDDASPRSKVSGRLITLIAHDGPIDQGERLLADATRSLTIMDWSEPPPEQPQEEQDTPRRLLGRLGRRPRDETPSPPAAPPELDESLDDL
jgi:hypothetical protein